MRTARRAPAPASPVRLPIRAIVGALLALLSLLGLGACSDTNPPEASAPPTRSNPAVTIHVPDDAPTISAAVEQASPGTLILVDPGVYAETVTVETENLTIRGTDRNAVVLDGGDNLENGFLVLADGVAIENLTVHGFRSNGVIFTGSYGKGATLRGYRVSYVTAYNNGLYGLYAFNAAGGQIDHTYTSGHPDAGIYIGQCYPCDALVIDNVAENNAVGFQNTNAGGNLLVVRSVWRNNRVGIEPNSSSREELAPQRESTIVANLIESNNSAQAPQATEAFGIGVAIGGGQGNIVRNNSITGNIGAGVAVTSGEFVAQVNRVQNNTVTGNGIDLVHVANGAANNGNCFEANTFETSSPQQIESLLPCAPGATGGSGELRLPPAPPNVDYRTVATPPPQDSMSDAATAPANPATDLPTPVDLDALEIPT